MDWEGHLLGYYAVLEIKEGSECVCVCVLGGRLLPCLVLKYSLAIAFIVPHFISFHQVVRLLLRAVEFMAAIFLIMSKMKYPANNRLSGNVNCGRKQSHFEEVLPGNVKSRVWKNWPSKFGTFCVC